MTKYLPIWLEDNDGHEYHVKLNRDGDPYIVDHGLNKSLTILNIKWAPVGHKIEYPWFYQTYTVTRNDLLNDDI